MYNRNSRSALRKWAKAAVAKLPEEKRKELLFIAMAEIDRDGLRGDVSALWMERGYTMSDIPDMYP